jgi:DNA-binding NarL/FixJ family response regulator
MKKIDVCIVEDLRDIREGLISIISGHNDFNLLGAFETADAAFVELPKLKPEIVIMDINLPGMSGVECVRQLKTIVPQMQFMMFTVFESSEQVFEALEAGASGYLIKRSSPAKIIEAVIELKDGGAPMSTEIARKVVASFQKPTMSKETDVLTTREKEILDQLAKGLLYKEIGANLNISTGTVRQHIHNIYEKLHVQNRTEALNKAFQRS